MNGMPFSSFDNLKNIFCDLESVYLAMYTFTVVLKRKQDINPVSSLN